MFGVLMAVGPGQLEVDRMHDTLEMLANHEDPEQVFLVILDDAEDPRPLDPKWPVQAIRRTMLRQSRKPDAYSAMVAATLEGVHIFRQTEVDFVLKLDTDAAVIAPFSSMLATALARPAAGIVGSFDVTVSGATRDWTVWHQRLLQADRTWACTRRSDGRRIIWRKSRPERRKIARLRSAATANAPLGAHCLGGAYAMSRLFVERADLDWRPWVGTGLGEDVVVGLLCSASGLSMRSMVLRGEPFALAWQGLPAPPQTIAANGHCIVHSVKAGTLSDERELRAALWSSPLSH